MGFLTTKDGTEIFFKDWGAGRTVVFSHGWPLTADAWDIQMMFLGSRATASSRTIGAGTDGRASRGTATT